MRRASTTKQVAGLAGLFLLGTLVTACGGEAGRPLGRADALAGRADALLATLPVGAASLAEADLPGCRGRTLPAVRSLARYPEATDLLVVLVDGKGFCVDSPAVVLRSLGVSSEEGNSLPGDDPVPVRGPGAPGEGDDDPVPINGSGTRCGSGAVDGSAVDGSAVDNGDDDPVPINGKHVAQGSSSSVTAQTTDDGSGDDGSGTPSHPLNPRLLTAGRGR